MHLTLNIFGQEFGERQPNPFGLHTGQMRSREKQAHNGAWYNQDGVRVGWGDLSSDDFRNIQKALEPGEYFFVLPESSFWNFVRSHGPIGSMCDTDPTIDHPGLDYVRSNFRYLITREGCFFKSHGYAHQTAFSNYGIMFLPLVEKDLEMRSAAE
jgi:hypothetical protein